MKVKLPYGIAKSIEKIKSRSDDPRTLFNYPNIASHAPKNQDYAIIHAYINANAENFQKYYQAISFGFEIEKTPEQEFRERYELYLNSGKKVSANAMKEAIDILGIKIPGIN